MDKQYKYILYILWLTGIITIGFIIYKYFCIENNSTLLGAFGILISAFLASVTMARSYAQNERFNQEEKNNNEFKIKKFALLSALDIYHAYNQSDNSLETLRELKHEYADRIEISSELLKEFYDDLYLAVDLLYEDPEEVIITKVSLANNRLLTQADLLQIRHPFKRIEK
ncbi:hypothetical protein MLC35_09010 [Sulfurimonas sp. NW7]|uniref:hypothetical protein n=1 Tax=Sulfurimonas sp. NW7 TaxID=2922727 RepID=UPI003DA996AE